MNAAQREATWHRVEKQIRSGAPPAVVARGEHLALASNPRLVLPHRLAALLAPEMVAAAKESSRARETAHQAEREAARLAAVADREQRQAWQAAHLDDPGYLLLAGERTEIVRSGTLGECLDAAATLPYWSLPRDPVSGRGCWRIVRTADSAEIQSGEFDRDGLR